MAFPRCALLLLALAALHGAAALKLFGHDMTIHRTPSSDEKCTKGPCDVTSREQMVPRAMGDEAQILAPWAQLSMLAPFMQQMQQQMQEAMSSSRAMAPAISVARTAVDVRETPDAFEFVADVPGIGANKTGVSVSVSDDNTLTISGERRFEAAADDEQPKAGTTEAAVHHRVERSFGKFVRSFQLPRNADGDKVSATVTSGVLTVRVPKKEVPPEQTRGSIPIEWKDL
jgi:HSP20 family protein